MNLVNVNTSSRPELSAKSPDTSTDIAYSIGDNALGKILVARSAVGVCAILIGSDDDELTNDLAACFPMSRLIPNEPRLRDDLDRVARFVERPDAGLDLPLDMRRGTPFQRRVWDALRAIPCGTMVTYAALARRIGEPKAARAIATACAANAIALGIPCHRVVRSNGTLSGYRWGIERKRALIDKEARP
ncbi:methylated-DNA-[protein]-cysteine S-methyltransferase/AraC family transcriptional regulator of adaptative response/methylated-DNA-[protein]-cysteine methyltransferase [Rhizobium sp. BK313]|jgi:methylated-DNA-[protein]-cysteine S-methyltransferase/AraC family transcriptional regulator of adaptative response/methylated-DNA-[protein]-cysteine methyltransferase|uniref:methylated-DNA--[protein]-cysteine S-methyltransferase n=1 Tax=Rhizobium sp. BK313 TaxID=2587081 RepID=UPI00105ECA37|nr:methylated-DNA--[protein]-cysteine S-methyltransferase [Rhizobium sp. BK313]MBB3458211.1 methylated-DNA-[protein]-cysteine S-methyltransferase/AraC family transcriptional regulator of adaptative response/methylated-DNA-[protein]-cysteine methyltransferase [Rhizobium sp. BK313]